MAGWLAAEQLPTTIELATLHCYCNCCSQAAMRRMGSVRAQEFLHLTAVNPYIVGSLSSGTSSGKGLRAHLPRTPSGGPMAAVGEAWSQTVGISGFAFQGTNAHVILAWCVLL